MLPCSVIVQEQNNEIEVAAVDPVASMMARNHSLVGIASEIKEKLERAIASL
jgi:hypothetical protein